MDNFIINVTTGSAGHGSERGFSSILQLIQDNEKTETAFFRPGSVRGLIFVSDEEDQSMVISSPASGVLSPWTHYTGICQPKTVDGYTYTLTTCPDATKLLPVADVKAQLDAYFSSLDGQGSDPNYFVASIVPLTGNSIQELQARRTTDDAEVMKMSFVAVDRGDRYLELGQLVGNGSIAMDLAQDDYSPILEAIGKTIVEKRGTFTLSRAPTGKEDMVVKVRHADESETLIAAENYTINEKSLVFTDVNFLLTLASTDRFIISYQPKTVY